MILNHAGGRFLATVAVDRSRLWFRPALYFKQNEDAANMVGVDTTALQDHRLHLVGAVLRDRRLQPTRRGPATSIRPNPFPS